MKFGIDIGHNSPPDTGAVGIKFEDALNTDVGNRVISKLRALGHEVILCKPDRSTSVTNSLFQRINTANTNRVEVFVSIHFNAFNGRANGTEVFAASETGRRIAQPVLNEIVSLGFFNRGVKSGSHLYVLRNTNMPAILVECCFVDSPRDMNIFEPEATANAIVKGLTGQVPSIPVNPVPDEELNTDTTVIRLQRALNQLKINDRNGRPLVEDNSMGPATSSATVNFQNIVGLPPSGIADTKTWDAINLILAKRIIRPNHAGGPVMRYLQYRVGAGVDGIYGPQTGTAIRTYQRQNGLLADGIVGGMTWQRLIG
ncbi:MULTISPECIES: N-acetylmuramoyl-L-alanine amidase [unclassified Nodularia (in: cyanobacteria)]|uniref:N-acetylmuramoyl-L-alanine amidase n=1 Tax=unclassified Nodularia (in: cyanobacteria) TaxID=2656917 RepID=UPI001880403E|nr:MULTISPECIES: N-acetylmuramoyl-L-alanine amidase [unclassified Nodularia (in: cyanobacteria)]MBE9200646.1 N-acetylmuramoyl-L-alanine amidase [Nodularia sp. LEGE 06071]MCC2694719.1 N-acetylmuramoyl-L-alanine amidase [Nodularia sp. LEGE 04288]